MLGLESSQMQPTIVSDMLYLHQCKHSLQCHDFWDHICVFHLNPFFLETPTIHHNIVCLQSDRQYRHSMQ